MSTVIANKATSRHGAPAECPQDPEWPRQVPLRLQSRRPLVWLRGAQGDATGLDAADTRTLPPGRPALRHLSRDRIHEALFMLVPEWKLPDVRPRGTGSRPQQTSTGHGSPARPFLVRWLCPLLPRPLLPPPALGLGLGSHGRAQRPQGGGAGKTRGPWSHHGPFLQIRHFPDRFSVF